MRTDKLATIVARRGGFALALALALAGALPVSASPDLSARLARAGQLLQQASQAPANAGALARQAAALAPEDHGPGLPAAVAAPTAANLARARREIAALHQAASLAPPAGGTTTSTCRATMQQVLARNEFQHVEKSTAPGWLKSSFATIGKGWNDFWGAIGRGISGFFRWLARLLPAPSPSKSSSPDYSWLNGLTATLRYILIGLIIAVVLFGLGLLLNLLLAARRRQAVMDSGDAPSESDSAARRKQEPSYWERSIQQAEALWQQGQQREAMRVLYRACLVLLDSRGMLRYDDTRANGEVLRELRRQGQGAAHDTLRPIVRCFDRSWYGSLNISSEEFTQTLEHSRHFRQTVVGGG